MARLSNKEIWDMSLNEAAAYTDAHPAEAWRLQKLKADPLLSKAKRRLKMVSKTKTLFASPETCKVFD